ncbi:MAG: UDP-glucose 4-epimerase [Rickettsiales bacterium]|nr:UDP-glucose 4-epimerase [Rickettsiales bacterium]
MKILITGGSGYIGSLLCPFLLNKSHSLRVLDTCYFGYDFLPHENKNFELIKGDIRDLSLVEKSLQGIDTVIHLACISNDASFELDEQLSTTINLDAFEPLVRKSKESGVKRFVYASSSSVYGLSDKKDVKEDHPLIPLTLYNKFKGLCEPILFNYTDENFTGVIFRPATVCGFAPRMRFDLSVNILTNHAINNKLIKVFGGNQMRPNLHIQDYCDVVDLFINIEKEKIQNEIFNVGFQNMTINNLAELVKKTVERYFEDFNVSIEKTSSNDNRSYHINSDKIYSALGFKPKKSIENAIEDICNAFQKNMFDDSMNNTSYYNVKKIKELKIK